MTRYERLLLALTLAVIAFVLAVALLAVALHHTSVEPARWGVEVMGWKA